MKVKELVAASSDRESQLLTNIAVAVGQLVRATGNSFQVQAMILAQNRKLGDIAQLKSEIINLKDNMAFCQVRVDVLKEELSRVTA